MAKNQKAFLITEEEARYLKVIARRDGKTETDILRQGLAFWRILDERWNQLPDDLRAALARSPFREEN
jgi:hypothetical protein